MPLPRFLSRYDRAVRAERIAAAYQQGAPSRAIAEAFGMSDGRVREIARLYGVARPCGRPRHG